MPVGHRSVLGAFVPEAARSTHARHLTMAMLTHHTPTMLTASQKCYQVITGTSSKDVHEYFWNSQKNNGHRGATQFQDNAFAREWNELLWASMSNLKGRCQKWNRCGKESLHTINLRHCRAGLNTLEMCVEHLALQQFATFGTTMPQKKRPVDVFVGAAHPLHMEELRSCKIAKKHRKVTKTRLFRIWQDLCVTCFWNALYKFKGMFPT